VSVGKEEIEILVNSNWGENKRLCERARHLGLSDASTKSRKQQREKRKERPPAYHQNGCMRKIGVLESAHEL